MRRGGGGGVGWEVDAQNYSVPSAALLKQLSLAVTGFPGPLFLN